MGEKGTEEIMNIREDKIPVGRKEARAKAIWTRTGVCIHAVEGASNLRSREGEGKGTRIPGILISVELGEIEIPGRLRSRAQKVGVVREKNGSLPIVVSDLTVTIFQQMDGVFMQTVDMEKLGVLVPLDGNANFAALPPISNLFLDCKLKRVNC